MGLFGRVTRGRAILHNVPRFASVEDLKQQLPDKWRPSEDRYCKDLGIMNSFRAFVCLVPLQNANIKFL